MNQTTSVLQHNCSTSYTSVASHYHSPQQLQPPDALLTGTPQHTITDQY